MQCTKTVHFIVSSVMPVIFKRAFVWTSFFRVRVIETRPGFPKMADWHQKYTMCYMPVIGLCVQVSVVNFKLSAEDLKLEVESSISWWRSRMSRMRSVIGNECIVFVWHGSDVNCVGRSARLHCRAEGLSVCQSGCYKYVLRGGYWSGCRRLIVSSS